MSPGEIWRRLHFLLNRSRLERDLDDEMAAHRAMKQTREPRFGSPLKLREDPERGQPATHERTAAGLCAAQ
jgi:hypothetical protein